MQKKDLQKKDLKKELEDKDYELNLAKYEVSLRLEKRTFLEMYSSLLSLKLIILFTFFNDNNYNSFNIKVSLFFFTLSSFLTINVLFFNDLSIHNIYKKEGKYDLIYQIPQILYSFAISLAINILMKHLSLSEKEVLLLKNNKKLSNKKTIQTKKCVRIKFYYFYITTFLLLLFFWFYLSCFCAVYNNSQKYVLTDTSISYGLSLLYPFLFTLLACVLRTISINKRNRFRECIYIISQLI